LFRVCLPVYEGFIDGLFSLLQKKKITPLDVEIAKITSAYLRYLYHNEPSLDEGTDFLVTTSNILLLKSNFLLNIQNNKEEEEFSFNLEEYRGYKDASIWLYERFREEEDIFPINIVYPISEEKEINVSIFELFSSLKGILEKRKGKEIVEFVIDEPKLEESIEKIKDIFKRIKKIKFIKLMQDIKTRIEVIITFLAILELIRISFLRAVQYRPFSNIWLIRK